MVTEVDEFKLMGICGLQMIISSGLAFVAFAEIEMHTVQNYKLSNTKQTN